MCMQKHLGALKGPYMHVFKQRQAYMCANGQRHVRAPDLGLRAIGLCTGLGLRSIVLYWKKRLCPRGGPISQSAHYRPDG